MHETDEEVEYSARPDPRTDGAAGRDDRPRPAGANSPGQDGADGDRRENRARASSPLKKRIVRAVLVAGVVIVLVAGGIWFYDWWTHGRFVQSTNDAYLQADQVAVSTRVAGIVDTVFVTDNEAVHVGAPLVQIDNRDFRARLEQAWAQADQGRASIAHAEAQIRQQDAQIAQAQAQLDAARSQERFADREATRYAQLAASGAETGERYDQMRQNRDQAHAQVAQSAAGVLAAQRQIDTLRTQITQAQAQIEQAEAQARQAQVDLDSTLVRASIDGRIGDRSVRAGQYVQPGTRMMSVVPVQAIYLVANFKETQVGLMRPGQPVTVSVDALDGVALHGVVDSFAPGTGAQFALIPPNNATGNFTKIVQRVPVRIRIEAGPETQKVLVPGLSVTAAVDTISARNAAEQTTQAQGKEPSTKTAPADGAAAP